MLKTELATLVKNIGTTKVRQAIGPPLRWIGIVGLVITLYSNIEAALGFAAWTHWISSNWHELLTRSLQLLPLQIDRSLVSPITLTAFLFSLAIGARFVGPYRVVTVAELWFPTALAVMLIIFGFIWPLLPVDTALVQIAAVLIGLGFLTLVEIIIRRRGDNGGIDRSDRDITVSFIIMVVIGIAMFLGAQESFRVVVVMAYVAILLPMLLVISGPPALARVLGETIGILTVLFVLAFVGSLGISTQAPD